ncbi:hypothetical protein MRV_0097 [Murid herpesvirus 3]|uniref:Uncharacterized protein n=2 Tax=Murid betaherpesvirus 3 TaxID=2560603 RepID=A0A1P8VIY3_9BETA|nr:hypothetical protein MRV_0097 [Murine roseolovirus]APZ76308.1 hypothetical protein MRV_0097 [Murid betaherpesvirus 3]AYH64813.1 hypothetical protein MRV_0097 [Murid herpesvirus 3]
MVGIFTALNSFISSIDMCVEQQNENIPAYNSPDKKEYACIACSQEALSINKSLCNNSTKLSNVPEYPTKQHFIFALTPIELFLTCLTLQVIIVSSTTPSSRTFSSTDI